MGILSSCLNFESVGFYLLQYCTLYALSNTVKHRRHVWPQVHSMPELKSEALLVGAKKALHDRGLGGYLPSQLEAGPKPRLQVRTDWKAKYLK